MEEVFSEEYDLMCEACGEVLLEKDLQNHACQQPNTDSIEEIIISAVQQRPPLWDHRIPLKNRDKSIRNRLWGEVSDSINNVKSPNEVEKIFKNIRDEYLKQKKKPYVPSGSGARKRKTSWKHYEACEFMSDSVEYKKTKTNLFVDVSSPSSCTNPSDAESPALLEVETPAKCKKKNTIEDSLVTILRQAPPAPPVAPVMPFNNNFALAQVATLIESIPREARHKFELKMLTDAYALVEKYTT